MTQQRDPKYIRERQVFRVTIKKLGTDRSPAGKEYDIAVCADKDNRLIDAKFEIAFPARPDRYTEFGRRLMGEFMHAMGNDPNQWIGRQCEILVDSKDASNGKRYWNVVKCWPTDNPQREDFGGGNADPFGRGSMMGGDF